MLTKVKEQLKLKAQPIISGIVNKANSFFNGLSSTGKKTMVLGFGLITGGISFMLIMQALSSQENRNVLSIESIRTPKDIYMKQNNQILSDDELVPVGKLKGEINGEFEAFYLAVDLHGNAYINH